MLKAKRAVLALYYFIMNAIGKFLAFAVVREDDQIWLISERNFDAKDNGFHFFKYMNKEHPEIKTYYVIPKRSGDYDKVAAIGNTVSPGSIKHYFLLYFADALISTHAHGYTPDMVIYSHFARHGMFKPHGKTVFLQHGVTDKVVDWLRRDIFKPDMFVVSAGFERDMVENILNQPADAVRETGLCRFDTLTDESAGKKQIFFMPTWRIWLKGLTKEQFEHSDYCQHIQRILKSEKLSEILKKSGYQMVFYPHVEMQPYLDCFTATENIIIADPEETDVQQCLKESALLITDFSSVYFDFMYMDKPVVFYQWDKKKYATDHYQGFVVQHAQFGTVCDSTENVTAAVKRFTEGQKPRKVKNVFLHKDKGNCARTYREVLRLCQKSQ